MEYRKSLAGASFLLLLLAYAAAAAGAEKSVTVKVKNPNASTCSEIVEVPASKIFGKLKRNYCYVVDGNGQELPSQLTADNQFLFRADVTGGATAVYRIKPSDTEHRYSAVVTGREYPERADDVAWENETSGYRLYGPATQAKGEKAYGYDVFFKYVGGPVVEDLYSTHLNADSWRKVDSLRKADKEAVGAFIRSFSYHVDHGKGMDCYAVGPTLGAGVAAPVLADGTLAFPWCYTKAKVVDNGPLRFTLDLEFAPRAVGNDSAVVETRRIILDSGSLLNRCLVSYKGLSDKINIATGFPLRDRSGTIAGTDGILAYSDPTQGEGNGRAYLGIVCPAGFEKTSESQGHVLGINGLSPSGTYEYYWGSVWDKNYNGLTLGSWGDMLREFAGKKPFRVKID